MANDNPQEAMVFADLAMKSQVKNSREAWITQATILYDVKDRDLWRHHPKTYSSFFAWRQQPETELPPSVVVDMLAVVRFAPALQEQAGIDIFLVIRKVGQSKIRQLVPIIRDACKTGALKEQVAPLLDEVRSSSFQHVLRMVSAHSREPFDPEGVYRENRDGSVNLTLRNLSLDDLETSARKVGLKRWFNPEGYRIDNPLNQSDGESRG